MSKKKKKENALRNNLYFHIKILSQHEKTIFETCVYRKREIYTLRNIIYRRMLKIK